jgi:asparagine synthase (glutamine-hydrolysing)
MCGIAGIVGSGWDKRQLESMVRSQGHRGPDDRGIFVDPAGVAGLGHNRLSIIDLTSAGHQPMFNRDRSVCIVFNGEIYNYLELRSELGQYPYVSHTDTEVILAAYERWGEECVNHFIGMFAFFIWDVRARRLFAARDRFGVKPLYYSSMNDHLLFSSEIKALHEAGVPREMDAGTWATYLTSGLYDHSPRTFWKGVTQLPGGCSFSWTPDSGMSIQRWYDCAESALRAGEDGRDDETVRGELLDLLENSVSLRFRSDVPVGICLSGGLDSSLLLSLVHRVQGSDSNTKAFTFICDDPSYDETPWVRQMLENTNHPSRFCLLSAEEVPDLAARVQYHQDEPFGGIPTLGMAKIHEAARSEGVVVLLDGNGMDEAWAGYDYYLRAGEVDPAKGPVQGSRSASVNPGCLIPDFASLAFKAEMRTPFDAPLQNLQYRDIRYSKIPRAMRFADRVSMMFSRELREPFLDHRILELGLRQPDHRKIRSGLGKWLPRVLAADLMPRGVSEAPKRPVQTPQREWLRGPLRGWAEEMISNAMDGPHGSWFDRDAVKKSWGDFCQSKSDNSFYVWQWISLGLIQESAELRRERSSSFDFSLSNRT